MSLPDYLFIKLVVFVKASEYKQVEKDGSQGGEDTLHS